LSPFIYYHYYFLFYVYSYYYFFFLFLEKCSYFVVEFLVVAVVVGVAGWSTRFWDIHGMNRSIPNYRGAPAESRGSTGRSRRHTHTHTHTPTNILINK